MVDLRQQGSSKLIFPDNHRPDMEAIVVNTAGGITGGDRFDLQVHVAPNAALTLTTQAAERAYRAQTGELAHVTTRLDVAAGGSLQWLPQELILFERCALSRRLEVEVAPGARLLMVEPVVLGRAAMRETLQDVTYRDRIRITRGGRPLYIDGISLTGDAAAHMARAATGGGAGAMASVVVVAPDADTHLEPLRALLPARAGVSLFAPDLLVLRILAADSFDLRATLLPVLDHLSRNTLPLSWRL
jgi:urease accessory protein